MSTVYSYVLSSGKELQAAQTFLGDTTAETPIVVAKRNGKIVGALATKTDKAVMAGPLKVSVKPGGFIALKLGNLYETLMRQWGVREYYIGVKEGADIGWLRAMRRLGQDLGKKNGYTWVKRRLEV